MAMWHVHWVNQFTKFNLQEHAEDLGISITEEETFFFHAPKVHDINKLVGNCASS